MTFVRPTSLRLRAAATALLTAAALLPAAAASAHTLAEAPLMPAPKCQVPVAAVGLPISGVAFAQPVDPPLKLAVTISGALPDGLKTSLGPGAFYAYGTPTKIQTSSYTVTTTLTKADGATETASTACSMTVQAAPPVTRIAGADRFEQSAKVSAETFDAAEIAYVASGENFADAVSSAAIAAYHEAPLLLTPQGTVSASVLAEIQRLGAKHIVVVGGPAAVSAAAYGQLDALAGSDVTRVGGADRFAVSRALIAHPQFGIPTSTDVYIATGGAYADALSASPTAITKDAPVLLVNGGAAALTTEEKATIAALGATKAHVVGGPAAVSGGLEASLASVATTDRFAGRDRFAVSAAINKATFPDADRVYLASGVAFPDALTGAVPAGLSSSPLYLTRPECLYGDAAMRIGALLPESVVVLGGTAAVSSTVEAYGACPVE